MGRKSRKKKERRREERPLTRRADRTKGEIGVQVNGDALNRILEAGVDLEEFLDDSLPDFLRDKRPHPKICSTRFHTTGKEIVMVQVRPGEDIWIGTSQDQVRSILETLNKGLPPMAPLAEA